MSYIPKPLQRGPPRPSLPQALATMSRGDVCIVFTPDTTHSGIATAAMAAGLHVLMAKPLVKTLAQHKALVGLAAEAGVPVGWVPGTGLGRPTASYE